MLNPASTPRTARSLPLLSSLLRSMVRTGRLVVIDAKGECHEFGGHGAGPDVTVRLRDRYLPVRMALNPSLALGEAYMNGTLTLEQGSLHELFHLVTDGLDALDSHPVQRLRTRFGRGRGRSQRNHQRRARSNVARHYDLSGTLYDLFLDADRQYSCAYFPGGSETLEEAQALKKRHLAAKLLLEPGCEVLDIGSGWGGLAIDLAQSENANVTGITLSTEQLEAARARVKAAGLSRQVRFELKDYREIEGRYDRIVSVGMFEHVGQQDYSTFFNTIGGSLKPDGVALIHSIGRMESPGGADAWISKYIFPGGYIPALSETIAAIEKAGLWITDIEILRVHYADTIRHWYDRFQQRRADAAKIYDERFCRMWEFYLAGSEMLFRNGPLMVFQIQLAHRRDAVPLTRDYITDYERNAVANLAARIRKRA